MIKELKTAAAMASLTPLVGVASPVLNTFAGGGGPAAVKEMLSATAGSLSPGLLEAKGRVESLVGSLRGSLLSTPIGQDVTAAAEKATSLFQGGLSRPSVDLVKNFGKGLSSPRFL